MGQESNGKPEIRVSKNGPLVVEGLEEILGQQGEALASSERVALCRCGKSRSKPFCDGSHAKVGFQDSKHPGRLPDHIDDHQGRKITIHDNRGVCSHAGFCTDRLKEVFRTGVEPWIDPDGAAVEKIVETIRMCPSGALSYTIEEERHTEFEKHPSLQLAEDGPISVKGGIRLVDVDTGQGASDEHYTLCRCGGSKNKPFCDGSHWYIGFKGADGAMDALQKATVASPSPEEPENAFIRELAANGLSRLGKHGRTGAMGVPRQELPRWDDLQFVTAQLHKVPRLDEELVGTELVIGPRAKKPLRLEIPLFVSDMSFGSLSEEAKTALAQGAELAGTGICSGEGGMLPEEQQANSRYFYELASARFGFSWDKVQKVQAFHFKGGQAAKTGTGGHLPGNKVVGKIAEVRGLEPGRTAVSPARFPEWDSIDGYKDFAAEVRERTGGIPVGFKLSAQHIEKDIDAALEAGADYIILDGRGGATGAAPILFRDNISVPTIPALARARRHLDLLDCEDVTLIVTGGLRTPADFAKALALGADGIAVANAAIQAIGCIGARVCNSNTCPSGVATQDPALRRLIQVESAAQGLGRFFEAVVDLMCVLARACGHDHLNQFCVDDLTTWKREMAFLSGVRYGGVVPLDR